MARVALVLGSGGARGYAHLGVIDTLRERGHEVVAVSGTSMGALVGGLHAAGRDREFETWARSLTGPRMLRLVDPTWSPGGAVGAERVMRELADLVGDVVIEELPIPFTAVATDLMARREVWFQRGPLVPAIRASVAIPGLLTPAVVDGRLLVDGGLMNPLPLAPAAAVAADFTLAVSLQGPREPGESEAPARGFSARRAEWAAGMRRRFRRGESAIAPSDPVDAELAGADEADEGHESGPVAVRGSDPVEQVLAHGGAPVPEASGADGDPVDAVGADVRSEVRTAEVVSLSFDAMQSLITRYRLAAFPPDVLVTVPLSAARTLDFHRASELIDLGRELTVAALDEAGR